MWCCGVDYRLVECKDGTGASLEKFASDCNLASFCKGLDMFRHLVEIDVQADRACSFLLLSVQTVVLYSLYCVLDFSTSLERITCIERKYLIISIEEGDGFHSAEKLFEQVAFIW